MQTVQQMQTVDCLIDTEVKTSQSQKTQCFCVADFATLSDERRSRSKIVLLFNTDKRTLRSNI